MSSFDKTVKLACKPKAAPPKAKYLDPIIAATYAEDGSIHDICKALSPKFREPNVIVVFKALIVLHTMIRNGATDNVLSYLSSEDVLKLRNVSNGQWDGYQTPTNLQNYAVYLDTRIRTYKDLKHDPVRIQAEVNRDTRVEQSLEGSRSRGTGSSTGPQRSKTLMGRKLRSMTVEKGLLRETKAVQKTIDTLLDCKFYLDNLEDELTVCALRMLVKDLIILFQALNEGVINVLEHYFEMSHVDAETALAIYRKFCKQTEKVLEYLAIARKLQNLLNVPIPNLKHAPVSLVSALEEYLNDPNFEQNRIEYKTNNALADKGTRDGSNAPSKSNGKQASTSTARSVSPKPGQSSISTTEVKPAAGGNKAAVDFFSSIAEEQTPPFNASQSQQQLNVHNPFVQRQSMMMTGAFPQQPFGAPQVPQPTGFIQPQHTAMPGAFPQAGNAFASVPSHPSFQSFLQPQATGFLQPQTTGANPFRQSMLMPQLTGMAAFGTGPPSFTPPNTNLMFSVPPLSNRTQSAQQSSFLPLAAPNGVNGGLASMGPNANAFALGQNVPQRPASTPITSKSNSFGQAMQPVVSHQTGSRNPFGEPKKESPPPLPKAPTLQQLATGAFNQGQGSFGLPRTQSPPSQPAQRLASPTQGDSTPFGLLSQPPASSSSTDGSLMANIASSFTFNNKFSVDLNKPSSNATGSTTAMTPTTSTFSSQPTGSTNTSSVSSFTLPPIQPQTTGFSGLKPFKPTSSFGASLLEHLPPIPGSESTTPKMRASELTSTTTGLNGTTSPVSGTNGSSHGGLNNGLASLSISGQNTQNNFSSGASSSTFSPTNTSSSSFGGLPSTTTGANSTPGLGALNAQPTGLGNLSFLNNPPSSLSGSNIGTGLRPQTTGGGVANPFRASMLSPLGSTPTGFNSGAGVSSFSTGLTPQPTGFQPSSSFGKSLFSSPPTNASKQQTGQQNGVASLI